MTAVDTWVNRHGWRVVTLVGAGALAWATLKAQVSVKADRADVESLRVVVDRIDKRTESIVLYLCDQRPHDLGCQR